MTEDDLKAIEARANAATPGPWRVCSDDNRHLPTFDVEGAAADGDYVARGWSDACGAIERKADAAFIAAARTDVPALVAEVLRLRQQIADSLVMVQDDGR